MEQPLGLFQHLKVLPGLLRRDSFRHGGRRFPQLRKTEKVGSQPICASSNLNPLSPAKFNRRHRESIVSKMRCGSVESRMRTERGGGSSSVFKNALAAWTFRRSAPTMTATLNGASVGLRCTCSIRSRSWSMVVMRNFDSGRTRWTSGLTDSPILRQLEQRSQLSSALPDSLFRG